MKESLIKTCAWAILVLTACVFTLAAASSCSNPADAPAFVGQGLTFDEAAERAVQEYWSHTSHAVFSKGTTVRFMWDDAGVQATGSVYTVIDDRAGIIWWRMPHTAPRSGNQWSVVWDCDPSEITYECRWTGSDWTCVVDWGGCSGMDDPQ